VRRSFAVVELLVRAGVTTVAEAAFQDRVWRPGLVPLRELAEIRIVHGTVDADIAVARRLRRTAENPLRRAHADPRPQDSAGRIRQHRAFGRVLVRGSSTGGSAPLMALGGARFPALRRIFR
jgi:hypothetical protein